MWPFSSAPTAPETVSSDTIIPFHWNDDTTINRAIVMDFTLRFDDVLEPEKLTSALNKLMTLGDWRKLGARSRLNVAGKLEYHVPESFTDERPGFSFSHVRHETSISLDPLASRLPNATAHPSTHPEPKEFTSLARRAGSPIKLEDYIYTDAPQISLHIVSFSDATLITLSWPHTFADAMGAAAIFDAWVLVLNGKESDVPPLTGFSSDPLATFGSAPTEKFAVADHQLKGLNMLLFGLRYAYELLWYSEEEGHVVCIPASTIAKIKATALDDLDLDKQVSFLSDGDVLTAWWSRLILQEMPWTWNRTISIMNAFSLRGVLSGNVLPPNTSCVSNVAAGVYAILPCRDIIGKHVAATAAAMRKAIVEQGTKEQMDAFAAIYKAGPPVFGDASTFMLVYTNWTKGRFYEVDFGAAVVGRDAERRDGRGRPTYTHVAGHTGRFPTRNVVMIFGRDGEGNYWMTGILRAGVWARVEAALKAF